ncbi:FAD-linked oxidase C-terminal domain-containing protein [Sorangium sp. So ce291]|uniref:FAD-linked oxidase C-terminal domain-containing protein n=1 Tax=Sorangium sp. So ce291 TaxID=3133294 RepID=UPI003F5D9166
MSARADGTVLRTGDCSHEDVAGHDRRRLLVCPAGTLAMVTELTPLPRRRPRRSATVVAMFGSLEASGRAVAAIVRSADASLLEIMDHTVLRAVERHARLGLDTEAAAMLIAQSDAPGSDDLVLMHEACEGAGATLVSTTEDEGEGQMLFRVRRLALLSLEQLGTVLVAELAVPLPQLPEIFRRIEAIAAGSATTVGTMARAGDGNLRPLVVFDRQDAAAEKRAVTTLEAIMAQAIELGGTITGEHGVGTLERGVLAHPRGAASSALRRRTEEAFGPEGILDQEKAIAPPGGTRDGSGWMQDGAACAGPGRADLTLARGGDPSSLLRGAMMIDPQQSVRQRRIIETAMTFPMGTVLERYSKDHKIAAPAAKEHERELKRFLCLCAMNPSTPYEMRGPIDHLWHTFLIFTKQYAEFCQQVASQFIHHFPLEKDRSVVRVAQTGYERFLQDYEATFGERAPAHLWPPAKEAASAHDGGLVDIGGCSDECGRPGCAFD